MVPGTYTLAQLAEVLQRSERRVTELLRSLETDHGFPRRLPGFGALWSRAAVDDWLARSGRSDVTIAGQPIDTAINPLDQRYGDAA